MEETQNQKSIVIGAVVLAVLVAAVMWYVLIVRPSTQQQLAKKDSTPTPTATVSPTPSPTEDSGLAVLPGGKTTDQPRLDSTGKLTVVNQGKTEGTKDVKPTTKTGPTEWLVTALLISTGTGAWGLKRLRKN